MTKRPFAPDDFSELQPRRIPQPPRPKSTLFVNHTITSTGTAGPDFKRPGLDTHYPPGSSVPPLRPAGYHRPLPVPLTALPLTTLPPTLSNGHPPSVPGTRLGPRLFTNHTISEDNSKETTCSRLVALAPRDRPPGYKAMLHTRKERTAPQDDDLQASTVRTAEQAKVQKLSNDQERVIRSGSIERMIPSPSIDSNGPGQLDVPPGVHPGTLGPLPMINLAPTDELRARDFGGLQRPRHKISGPAYEDQMIPSTASENLYQAAHTAEFKKRHAGQRTIRSNYMDEYWKRPHEPVLANHQRQPTVEGEGVPSTKIKSSM